MILARVVDLSRQTGGFFHDELAKTRIHIRGEVNEWLTAWMEWGRKRWAACCCQGYKINLKTAVAFKKRPIFRAHATETTTMMMMVLST